jgi:ferritin-like metal-binding protein YciE
MSAAADNLNDWLRDAYAMETQAIEMLSTMAGRLGEYPVFKATVEDHLAETRSQRERLQQCIDRRGGSTSTLKDWTAKLFGMGQGISGVFSSDEVIKGAMAGYTFENMEIAAYRAIISAAEVVGDMETSELCAQILTEEENAAKKLYDLIPALVAKYLVREEDAEGSSAAPSESPSLAADPPVGTAGPFRG